MREAIHRSYRPAIRLLFAVIAGLSLFIAMTPTTPEKSTGCTSKERYGTIVVNNNHFSLINVRIAGPTNHTQNLGPDRQLSKLVKVGTYRIVANNLDAPQKVRIHDAYVSRQETVTITVDFK
jgi:hypothetical protein